MSPNRLAWAEAGFEQADAEEGLVSCMKRVLEAARREAWTRRSLNSVEGRPNGSPLRRDRKPGEADNV